MVVDGAINVCCQYHTGPRPSRRACGAPILATVCRLFVQPFPTFTQSSVVIVRRTWCYYSTRAVVWLRARVKIGPCFFLNRRPLGSHTSSVSSVFTRLFGVAVEFRTSTYERHSGVSSGCWAHTTHHFTRENAAGHSTSSLEACCTFLKRGRLKPRCG